MKTQIILPLFVIGLAMASCKKEYTCECVTTDTYTNNRVTMVQVYNADSKAYGKKMTEKQAKAACDAEGPAVQSNFIDLYKNATGQPLKNEVIATTCKLK
jgi:hypothetical protein